MKLAFLNEQSKKLVCQRELIAEANQTLKVSTDKKADLENLVENVEQASGSEFTIDFLESLLLETIETYENILKENSIQNQNITTTSRELQTPIGLLRLRIAAAKRLIKLGHTGLVTPEKLARTLNLATYHLDQLSEQIRALEEKSSSSEKLI